MAALRVARKADSVHIGRDCYLRKAEEMSIENLPNPSFSDQSIRFADTETETQTFTLEEILAGIKRDEHQLILWNDDTNTFEHVIYCLVKYLKYSEGEGEKIAWTVHNKGKCTILEGTRTELEVYRKILQREGLTVSVE